MLLPSFFALEGERTVSHGLLLCRRACFLPVSACRIGGDILFFPPFPKILAPAIT